MNDYLSYKFNDTGSTVSTFDEVPLWSAAFGLLMLKHLELRQHERIIDIGSGAGFPLLEIAGRAGNTCRIFGIDPWRNANERAREKIKNYGYTNVQIIESSAEIIPFEENSIDLIVSNLGINNFENPGTVFAECQRILKPKGKLAITTNLNGHWKEFYKLFYEMLRENDRSIFIPALKKEEEHRGTIESISKLFTGNGFRISRCYEEKFEMKFVDGSAFLNHHFVKLGWLSSWTTIFPDNVLTDVFETLEVKLNQFAISDGGLSLTVPMAYIEGERN